MGFAWWRPDQICSGTLPEGRRHRRGVSGTVWVGGGDNDDGRAPIEDSGVEDLVRYDKAKESVLEG